MKKAKTTIAAIVFSTMIVSSIVTMANVQSYDARKNDTYPIPDKVYKNQHFTLFAENKIIYESNTQKHTVTKKAEIPLLYGEMPMNVSYMDYRKITNKSSNQYQYIHNSGEISINDDGYLVTKDNYIGVAMGSYWGDIGSKYIIYLDDGYMSTKFIQVVKIEAKADKDTCGNNYMGATFNDVIEVVIDAETEHMQKRVRQNGYIYSGNFNKDFKFHGDIIRIVRVEE